MAGHVSESPHWDQDLADILPGCRVLVGMIHTDPAGDRHEQVFGTIEVAAIDRGVAIRLEGTRAGELFWLPPDLRNYQRAKPGQYRLRSTDELVIDPDFTCSWTVTPRPQ